MSKKKKPDSKQVQHYRLPNVAEFRPTVNTTVGVVMFLPGALQSAHSSVFRRRLDISVSGGYILGEKRSKLSWQLRYANHWFTLHELLQR